MADQAPAPAMQVSTARQLRLLSNGSYSTGKGNAQNDYIWDRIVLPASAPAQGIPFFRVPRSGQYGVTAGDAKTEIETSMEDNAKLPAGQNFLANAVQISLITTDSQAAAGTYTVGIDRNLHAWAVLMQHSNFNFKFTNTEYSWRSPGVNFLPSVYQNGESGPLAATGAIVRSGDFQHMNWLNMPTKVPITEQVNFTVTMFTTSGAAALLVFVNNAMAFLNGATHACEVQTTLRGMLTRAI
jgi:hypothetical protein